MISTKILAAAPVDTAREPQVQKLEGGQRALQIWALPTEQAFLEEFLTYVFENYWDQIVFGPMIQGAAYEMTCPCKPERIRLFDGYLTVSFGGPHFHLCIGENKGPPRDRTSEDLKRRRRPSKAQIFRRLDKDGAPLSWGFEMENGAGEPLWERLAMWRDLSRRYLGREPEAFDESGKGYRGGHG